MENTIKFLVILLVVSWTTTVLLIINNNEDSSKSDIQVSNKLPKGKVVKETVLQDKDGKLYCPPPNKRRCLVINKVVLPEGHECSNVSCSDIEQELENLKEKYNSLLTFCDPTCNEQLSNCTDQLREANYVLHNISWVYEIKTTNTTEGK